MYTKEFKEIVEKENFYIGLGNPNAKMLFIGKEAGISDQDDLDKEMHLSNANIWKSGNIKLMIPFSTKDNKKLRNGNHTWQKYQKLHDQILNVPSPDDYYINFVKNVFTTELNCQTSPTTVEAKKNELFKVKLAERKNNFFKTSFIRNFPIVVITALDRNYISNKGDNESREIDTIFEVKFQELVSCKESKDKFWIHYSIF